MLVLAGCSTPVPLLQVASIGLSLDHHWRVSAFHAAAQSVKFAHQMLRDGLGNSVFVAPFSQPDKVIVVGNSEHLRVAFPCSKQVELP